MNLYINNCCVRILDNTDVKLFSNQGKIVVDLLSDSSLFKFNPTVIIADPFLFVKENRLYLFYENQRNWYGKGCICMRVSTDLNNWSKEKIVLEEPFHLSFPYVFEDKGRVYMIPETGHDGSVCLYESACLTLEKWTLKSKLIDDGRDWVDSSLIFDNGKYYLFSTSIEDEKYYQRLFFSEILDGAFKEHPQSPIYVGNDYGRNAGSVFKYQDSWMRPTQDCENGYGNNVSIFKINELSDTKYSEEILQDNIFDRQGRYKEGGHQFNFVDFNNRKIVATDYKIKNYNVFEFVRRLIKKIK